MNLLTYKIFTICNFSADFAMSNSYCVWGIVIRDCTQSENFYSDNKGGDTRQHAVPISAIFPDTIMQEGNNPKVVSFSIQNQERYVNYNIKFETEWMARHFANSKVSNEVFCICTKIKNFCFSIYMGTEFYKILPVLF